jgi:hypothetical protein
MPSGRPAADRFPSEPACRRRCFWSLASLDRDPLHILWMRLYEDRTGENHKGMVRRPALRMDGGSSLRRMATSPRLQLLNARTLPLIVAQSSLWNAIIAGFGFFGPDFSDRGLPTASQEPTSSGAGVTPACDTQRTGSGMNPSGAELPRTGAAFR